MAKQLDYSALPTKPPARHVAGKTTAAMILAACLIGYGTVMFAGNAGTILMYGYIAVIAVVIYQTTKSIMRRQQALSDQINRFAESNGFEYVAYKEIQNSSSTLLRLYKNSGNTQHHLSGEWCNLPISLYQFEYTFRQNSYQSNQRDTSVMVAELTLPKALPHIVIDAHAPDQIGGMSALPVVFHASQRIQLEGVFYKHFSVYAADKDRVTALSILTPDIMEALLKHAHDADVEIIGNKLFFYWNNTQMTAADIEKVFVTIAAIMPELERKLGGAKLSKANEPARLDAIASQDRLQRRALNPAPYYVLLPLAAVLFMLFATLLSPDYLWPSLGLVIVTIAVTGYRAVRQKKVLEKERSEHSQ